MIVMNSLIDLFFAFDIILNFFTSYFNSATGDEELEPKMIANNYLKGSFSIDFLSICPFDLILEDVIDDKTVLKAFSILKIFRILRL